MTIYADETYYTSTYLAGRAAILTAAYVYYFREASKIIDVYTFGNIDPGSYPDEVKMCCCELAETLYAADKEAAKSIGKTSESVQGWSVSYQSGTERKQEQDTKQHDIIFKWLSGSGLLFSGVR